MRIEIVPYQANWKIKFEEEKQLLKSIFQNESTQIEHIGSTAIKGLAAKPTIDILIGLENFSLANQLVLKIESASYTYVPNYEKIFPERRFFFKETKSKRTHHIHLVLYKSAFWNRHIFFRDYLRNDSKTRIEYQNLKLALAKQEWKNRNDYANAKSDFIKAIENKY